MAQTYLNFTKYFPEIDEFEAEALVAQLELTPGFKDIWTLAGSSREALARELEGYTSSPFKEYWTSLSKAAGTLTGAITPADPANPTPEEQALIDGLVPGLLALFPTSKHGALRAAIESYRIKKINDWQLLDAVSKAVDTDARAKQGDAFFQAWASYYLTTSAQFIAARSVTYRFLGRVLDSNASSAPKAGVKVSMADEHFVETVRQFGSTTTNREGYYRISFTVLNGTATPYPLQFTFSHPELGSPQEVALNYDPADPRTAVVSSFAFTPAASASKTIASTGVAVPADVQAYLAAQSITITRLEDIRRLGSLKNLPSDTIDKDNADLKKLDGLASLEVLQDDVVKNNALYGRGYTGIAQIANAPRRSFVEENTDILGDYGAGQLQFQAKAAHLHALNQLAGELTVVPERIDGEQPEQTVSGCGCPDCSSAVSPLAYLADLLAFAWYNTKQDDDGNGSYPRVSLGYLKSKFFHEFAELRTECEQLKGTICQNRIAAEILRSYHASIGSPNGAALLADERDYLFNAYELLLSKLGTSYAEIRTIRGSIGTEESERLTDRMGIIGDDGASTLEQLFIDASDPANLLEGSITEPKNLESLFGLRDSRRPLLEATPVSKVGIWKAARLRELWAEQDRLKNPYWNHEEVILDPDVVTADDFRFPQTSNTAFATWKARREWVDDLLPLVTGTYTVPKVDHRAADNTLIIYGGALPTPPSLTAGDPVDYVNGGSSPTYTAKSWRVAGDDFEITVEEDLELDRGGGTITVNGSLADNSTATRSFEAPDLEALLTFMRDGQSTYAPTSTVVAANWPEASNPALIANLRSRVGAVRAGDQSAIDDLLIDLQLIPAELYFLDEFLGSYKGYPTVVNSENNQPSAKWDEFRSILINVMKRLIVEAWITEETEEDIELGPADFWKPVREPSAGAWPPIANGTPLLDPDVTGIADLPELTVRSLSGLDALAMLSANRADLDAIRDSMRGLYPVSFIQLVNYGFNGAYTWNSDPLTDLQTILNSYYSATTSAEAVALITDTLRVTVEEFLFLMDVGTRRFSGAAVPQADIDRTIDILQAARKRIVLYPLWASAEGAATNYWKLLKARLPKWRATMDQRRTWLNALTENSGRPIIDPDLLGPGDLFDPTAGSVAFDLHEARRLQMEAWQTAIGDPDAPAFLADLTSFDAALTDTLDLEEPNLATLRDEQDAGTDIRPRLQQLTLDGAAFNQLLVYRDILAVGGNSLTKEEKTNVQHILANVRKKRQFLAFREQEVVAGITLSQDFFRTRESFIGTVPMEVEFELKPWLAGERDLILWRRMLKGRIEQEKSVLDAWQQALFEVDEVMMVHLRNALVRACANTGEIQIRAARRLGDRLLTDLENNCCFKTNRVAAAIETMQQFLWKLHTGDLLSSVPRVKFVGEDFEEAWTWMGSYANWRAAMFVFLYPENVLIPSLRRHQTPAFEDVVRNTRNNRRFGPNEACVASKRYKEYLEDVSNLRLACSVQAEAFVGGGGCGDPANQMKRLNFIFAEAPRSGKAYWATVDTPDPNAPTQQRFWMEIPELPKGATLKGATYYRNDSQEVNHIFLFYLSPEEDKKNTFFAARYALETGQWESEQYDYDVETDDLKNSSDDVPFDPEKFDTRIHSLAVLQNSLDWASPTIAITLWHKELKEYYTFFQGLDTKGDALVEGEWWDRWTTRSSPFEDDPGEDPLDLQGRIVDFVCVQPDQAKTGDWTTWMPGDRGWDIPMG